MIPVVRGAAGRPGNGGDDAYWWALALGACFGGNATMIAAAANVAAAGMAERAGTPIGFFAFLRVGLPVTLISMALATGYIAIRYIAHLRSDRCPTRSSTQTLREIEPLAADDLIGPAARRVVDAELPALPAVEGMGGSPGSSASASSWPRCSPATSVSLRRRRWSRRSVDETIERRSRLRRRADPAVPDHRPRPGRGRLLRYPARRALPPPPGADRPDRDRRAGPRGRHPPRLLRRPGRTLRHDRRGSRLMRPVIQLAARTVSGVMRALIPLTIMVAAAMVTGCGGDDASAVTADLRPARSRPR